MKKILLVALAVLSMNSIADVIGNYLSGFEQAEKSIDVSKEPQPLDPRTQVFQSPFQSSPNALQIPSRSLRAAPRVVKKPALKILKKEATASRARYEIAACVVNSKVKKNPAYYHLPSVNTQVHCDIGTNAVTGTLDAFYSQGWRMIQVVNIDNRLTTAKKSVPYSMMYLERQKAK